MTKLKDLKNRFMEDPKFREEYAWVDEEYALVEALVRARAAARLTEAELARPFGTTQPALAQLESRTRPPISSSDVCSNPRRQRETDEASRLTCAPAKTGNCQKITLSVQNMESRIR